MKKILYIHTGAELYGADIILLTLLKGLDKTKYKPIVVLPTDGPLVKELNKINIEVHIEEYPVLRRKYFSLKGIVQYIAKYVSSCKRIISIVGKENIDIVHANTIAVLEGIYISKKLNIPLIWHVHEILERPKVIYKITSAIMGIFATKIIAVSNAVKEHLLNSGYINEEKIQVIYNGVNVERFNPQNDGSKLRQELNIPNEAFIIGMIGRVNAIKGQEEFVKIVSSLISKYNNVYGVIVGDAFLGQEWRVQKLKDMIDELGYGDRLQYLGYRADTNILHCMFDVYILPSVSADSLPTVVLEAMASKRVVVGYKNGGICEMVDDRESGYLEEIYQSDKLIEDIEHLIENRELYDSMANCGYKRLKNMFSLEAFNEKIDCMYQNQ